MLFTNLNTNKYMYVYQRQATTYRGIATLLTVALVLWTVGFHMFTHKAEAANLVDVSDLLTDSEPSGTSVHTITFTTPTGMSASEVFTVNFPSQFDLTSLSEDDISVTVGGNASATDTGAPTATDWGLTVGGDNAITFALPTGATGDIDPDTEVILGIGDELATMIVNPAATSSYEIAIGNTSVGAPTTTVTDGAYTRVAIIENVLVTARINTTFTFTVTGTTTGAVCNGAPATFGPSTNTTLPFETLTAGALNAKTLCQDLTVATNAINGYAVTVEQDQQLESSTGADIDGFIDGAWTDDPNGWVSPSNNVSDEDTWGHWGLTSSDGETFRPGGEFIADTWVAASTTPTIIMGHDGPADGVTDGVGRASIGYQVEITALQEAGDDYNTTLTYIATPTF
jgi:hypothetical protein